MTDVNHEGFNFDYDYKTLSAAIDRQGNGRYYAKANDYGNIKIAHQREGYPYELLYCYVSIEKPYDLESIVVDFNGYKESTAANSGLADTPEQAAKRIEDAMHSCIHGWGKDFGTAA